MLSERKTSLADKLDKSLRMILEGIRADNGSIMLADEQGEALTVLAATKQHLVNKNQPVQAWASFNTALKKDLDNPTILYNAATAQDKTGNKTAAINILAVPCSWIPILMKRKTFYPD